MSGLIQVLDEEIMNKVERAMAAHAVESSVAHYSSFSPSPELETRKPASTLNDRRISQK